MSDPGRFERRNSPPAVLIFTARGIKGYQPFCPSWMKATGYDVIATIAEGATPEEEVGMLQIY
jgi:uncharacterized protein (TIGR03435 family)